MSTASRTRTRSVQLGPIMVDISLPQQQLIWLDTSIVFTWAQICSGKQKDHNNRLRSLMAAIEYAVNGGHTIVVEGFQLEEAIRDTSTVRADLDQLCRGWAIRGQREIEIEEWRGLMTAWMTGDSRASIDVSPYIRQPRLDAASEDHELMASLNKQRYSRRENTARNAEQVRRDCREDSRSFEAQLREEHDGYWRAICRRYSLAARALQDGAPTSDDVEWLGHAFELKRLYSSIGGTENPLDGLAAFFASPYGRAIPSHHVRATHWAHWMTIGHDRQVQSGDPSDNEHLQYALPYFDVVVCDNENRLMIAHRGLDRLFGVRVFSLSTIDALTNLLADGHSPIGATCD